MLSWKSKQLGVRRRRQKKRRIVFLILAIILLFLFGIGFFLGHSFFRIKNFSITDGIFFDRFAVEKKIKEECFVDSGIKSLILQNWFFGPQKCLLEKIGQQPQIKKAVLEKDFKSHSWKLKILEREPLGIFCDSSVFPNVDCFYFDDSGILFASAPIAEGDSIFVFWKESGELKKIGDVAILDFQEFFSIKKTIEEKYQLIAVSLNDSGLFLRLRGSGEIIFNLEDLFRGRSALENLIKAGFDLSRIKYLDLRFLPNIYYK